MSIISKKTLKINFASFTNFEKQLYPIIIKKFKSDFCNLEGFWYSVDNMKDLESLKKEIMQAIIKILKKLKKKLNDK